ncbi:SusC/RagA family TonB-linked outer membrane protein [Bacteroides sp. 51]|uniref:SusC/RagA family TonB-linked outer membrane protein n=1 Tax=Bacteroides sp. 51 TaxID=2302938 RepID=UPI0013D88C83|nr:SusC/RagA family TonB-linked outer membrane protein [Bacteroides sp. 51]NDV81615.1 SusC/RagA family TonB-linked outer membrane protein [Bacteroides sp. 51]
MKKKIIHISSLLLVISMLNVSDIKAQDRKDSLVNVAFGQVDKEDVIGAVSTVNIADLMEKSYSTYSLDAIQSMVGGYTGTIWGQGALILVDGIPRSQWTLHSTQVESVTILKDASSVALYGSKGAKGVVLITTKRGIEQPLSINVRANTGFYVPKTYPTYLNAAEYMTYYNEACRNDGITERYSQSTIYNTITGTNPYRYPDVDFYSSDYLKKAYNKTDVIGELSGGNKHARYYSNFGMTYENDLVKYGEKKEDNTLTFRLRSNIDMNLTNWLTASADAAIVIANGYYGDGDFWGQAATLRPNWFSPLIPVDMIDTNNSSLQAMVGNSRHLIDGKYLLGGLSTNQTNAFADMLAGGYTKARNRTFQFNVCVGADLGSILKGLSFKTAFSVDYADYYSEVWSEAYAVYEPTWTTVNGKDMISGLTKYNVDKPSTNESIGTTNYTQTMSFRAQFDYKRTFAHNHNVSGTLMGWGYQQQYSRSDDTDEAGSDYHRISNVNMGLQAGYNYQQKYYVDFTGALVHSAKLPSKNRTAFSPTFTVGWRLSNEDFFKDNVSFVDDLKLTASYGKLHQDLDISDYYLYKTKYNTQSSYFQWKDGGQGGWFSGIERSGNAELSFVEREDFRIGLNTSLLDGLVSLDANYFIQNTNGLLTQGASTTYPSFYSSLLPYINYNKDKRTGVDFSLNLKKKMGEVDATLGFSGMYISTEAVRRDEAYQETYQNRAGRALDSYWGYICEGFFQDQDDINNHASQTFGTVQPGDLKYKDVNNDGIIDTKDQVDLGHNGWSVAPFSYGINLTLKWKNFTFFALGTGQSGAIGFKDSSYYWVRGSSKYSDIVKGAWTEATKETATYPRLTTTDNSNNFRNSTFWMYKTDRFDLKRIQITYDFPKFMFNNSFVNALSVYCNADDLLTISKEREHMEMNVGSSPQCRFFNVGAKVSF